MASEGHDHDRRGSRLAGRRALVTGAARGIGAAVAASFVAEGADVVVLDLPGDGLKATAHRLGAHSVGVDLRDVDGTRAATAEAIALLGGIDVLVNNAGIGPPNRAESVTEADFDRTLAVNLKGTFFVSQAVGRVMIAGGGGRIVNLGSQAGAVALPTESVYCMTKAAIAHLTKCLAVEWARHGINVNAVAPTFIRTPGTVKWLQDDAFRTDLLARIPLGRVGEPADVSAAVVFLASPAAALITGTTLLIDGGFTAR
jgi:NAD(P)-dependent dehydrogenase (short-subunit alcohol dehydrogenase family)